MSKHLNNDIRETENKQEYFDKIAAVVLALESAGYSVDNFDENSGFNSSGYNCCQKPFITLDVNLTSEQKNLQKTVLLMLGHARNLSPKMSDEDLEEVASKDERSLGLRQEDKYLLKFALRFICDSELLRKKEIQQFLEKRICNLAKIVTLESKIEDNDISWTSLPSFTDTKDVDVVKRFEPRIYFIIRQLRALLGFLTIVVNGQEQNVVSVRLNELQDWVVKREVDSSVDDPYLSVMQYLSSTCKAECKFCLHKNDPPGSRSKASTWSTSIDEIAARLELFDPKGGNALFRSQDYNYYDILTHPKFFDVLRGVRAKTNRVIGFATNGGILKRDFLKRMAEYKPYYLMVSLNSAKYKFRKKVMRQSDVNIAIRSLPLLKEYKLLYSVSIVPWHEIPLDDLDYTIRYADENDSYIIRINLDAYSSYFPYKYYGSLDSLKTRLEYWKLVIDRVRAIRKKISTPIILQPSMVEEMLWREHSIEAVIGGIIKNSPAAKSGLERGDIIIQIDEYCINSCVIAASILKMYHHLRVKDFTLKVRRGGFERLFRIKEFFDSEFEPSFFPHFPCLGDSDLTPVHAYGIVLQKTLNPKYLYDIDRIITKRSARRVLFLSSFLVAPIFSKMIEDFGFLAGRDVQFSIAIPENRHYLGGSIIPGDLLVVDDFIQCIQEYKGELDLVIIPSTPFGRWGRDISGKCYKEIERITSIPVELLKNEMLTVI